ncbi:DegQ family serine endoprotease [Geotalea sp. SG265]|uniref:DegQ family serine endoprotease n=1 Tax=Geotalea sp. SG265 TaxID=2922867 RepID=UPI001FAEE3C6|nr:DegQ family serine endoprotease [Geotalea sp. SG265]
MAHRVLVVLLVFITLLPACRKKEEAYFSESSRKGAAEAPVKEVPRDILATQQAFSNVVKAVNPAVVNISTISKKKLVQPFFEMSPFFEDFFGGGGGLPRYRRENSLGSGFIISKDGYIITNDHVVRDAESIQVTLSDEKSYKGKVVGSDPKTDIAVIKIGAKGDLPVAVLGDSDKLSVGQWAIAIGNPFGLNRTVTVGVISATGRSNMGIETYENFIQTDASINPGNSGGPLLNVYGEVIGINTAIVAAGQGIGFAIPINMAKVAVPQLIKKGNVTRGWLGISIQPVTEDLAQSFGLKRAKGALVSDVVPGSPAAKAGLRQGDVVTRYGGKEITSVQQLQLAVANTPVGTSVEIEVLREGQTKKLTVAPASADSAAAQAPATSEAGSEALGLTVAELPRELRQRGLQGVIVTDVEEGSLAAESGIQQGDVLVSVNQKKISGTADYARALKDAERKGSVALLARRGNASIYFAMKLR